MASPLSSADDWQGGHVFTIETIEGGHVEANCSMNLQRILFRVFAGKTTTVSFDFIDDQGLENNVEELETFESYENITDAETSENNTFDGICPFHGIG